MKNRVVLGTMNPSKLEEMQSYFTGTAFIGVSPREVTDRVPEIPESSDTVRGNAILKAKAWHRMTGFPVIAEDSGLLFMDLPQSDPDQPGQFVRRFHGKSMTDEEMLEHYIDIIHRHGGELRACWLNCWCLLEDQDHGETYENRSLPFLLRETPSPLRHTGWPLDSISWIPESGKYLVECTAEDLAYRNRKGGYTDPFHDWIRRASECLANGHLPNLTE